MAELFVSVIADKVLGKLGSFAYQELCLAWSVKNYIQELADTLTTIKIVLLDAEEQQAHNPKLRLWLEKLKDVCYDAEDALDEIEVEVLRKQVIVKYGSISRKVCNFFSSPKSLAFRFKVGHKIKSIRERLNKIAAEKTIFDLTERVDGNKHVMSNDRETHSFVYASDVIGRDKDKEEIIKRLMHTDDCDDICVIPIVGIGGLGKTTLAKLIYNHKRVDEYFDLKIWICVSDEFIVKNIIIDIVNSISDEKYTNVNLDGLQGILRDILSGKKYLLVMDDVWNENFNLWIELRTLLPRGINGSKIIVTTRSNQVATIMATIPPYKLEGLSREECLLLFVKYVFRDGQEKQYPNLIKIGEEIVKKCGGVPLAVRTLGSLLHSSNDEFDWNRVRDSEIWKLEQKNKDILPALRLSYDHLPSYLKQCFAYCSIYPKNHVFYSYTLIQFWMANGLLQSSDKNQDLENIGMQYLKELISRSFFQDLGEQVYGLFYRFKMHDLMHDLASSLMERESITVTSRNQSIPRTVRHLTFVDADTLENDLPNLLSTCHARTILSHVKGKEPSLSFPESIIPSFKFLRCLDLHAYNIEVLLEKNIENLKHLRFLCLLGNSKIKKLPNSIWKLHSLQTISLSGCKELEELPRDIRYLINLRFLILTTKQRRLPQNGIGCLNSLRFLFFNDCDNLEYLFEDINHLKVLRTLVIGGCPKLKSLPHNMKHLSTLENLILEDCESLVLNLSGESGGENNLQELISTGPPLRMLWILRLPRLVELPQWLRQGTLQTLHIQDCPRFKELPESVQDLKSLQLLRIWGCPELSTLPENVNCLTALRELTIRDSPTLVEKCKPEEGEDWPKIAHIPNIQVDGKIIKPSIYLGSTSNAQGAWPNLQ